MDILWSYFYTLYYIQTQKLIFFSFLLFVLIWCRSGEILVGQADFSSPPDRLSCKVFAGGGVVTCRAHLLAFSQHNDITVIHI